MRIFFSWFCGLPRLEWFSSFDRAGISTLGVRASGRSGRNATASWCKYRSTLSPCAPTRRRKRSPLKCFSSMATQSITLKPQVVRPTRHRESLLLSAFRWFCSDFSWLSWNSIQNWSDDFYRSESFSDALSINRYNHKLGDKNHISCFLIWKTKNAIFIDHTGHGAITMNEISMFLNTFFFFCQPLGNTSQFNDGSR